jgi:UDP-N-acetylglucosamine acyltransferase
MTALMTVHPTALVEDGVQLGEGCVVHAYANIKRGTVLGDGVVVHAFAVIGDEPQDLHFDPATGSGVRIGARTVIREHVTVHRSTRPGGFTEVGEACLLMVGCHVGHDGRVGNHVAIANDALLAGHVHVGDHAFLGGGAVIHQFCRIGESAMIGGGARISRDVPAFTMATERDGLIGLNVVGIRRRGFTASAVRELKRAFHLVYDGHGNIRENARRALDGDTFREPSARHFLAGFGEGTRGFVRPRRTRGSTEDVAD